MALGDYVRTAVGAVAKGASAIVAAILNRGGSGQEASAALRQTFPSLPGQIIGGLVTGTRNQLAAGQSVFPGGALAPAGLPLQIVGLGNIPTQQRVLVDVTLTAAGEHVLTTRHWVDMQPGDTLESAMARAQSLAGDVFGVRYPEEAQEGEELGDEEVTTRISLIQQRSGG